VGEPACRKTWEYTAVIVELLNGKCGTSMEIDVSFDMDTQTIRLLDDGAMILDVSPLGL